MYNIMLLSMALLLLSACDGYNKAKKDRWCEYYGNCPKEESVACTFWGNCKEEKSAACSLYGNCPKEKGGSIWGSTESKDSGTGGFWGGGGGGDDSHDD